MRFKIKPRDLGKGIALVVVASFINPWVAPLVGHETIGLAISFGIMHVTTSSLLGW